MSHVTKSDFEAIEQGMAYDRAMATTSGDVTPDDIRRILGVGEYRRPWYRRVAWARLLGWSSGLVFSGLTWWGVVGLWLHRAGIWRTVVGEIGMVWADLSWFWNDAGDNTMPWLGPARWMLLAGVGCVVYALGVGAAEWWRERR